MYLSGVEFLADAVKQGGFSAKMVCNQHGAILFPVTRQHREMKGPGISYEDEYKGDALAAMLAPGSIEIRYHRAFADAEVARIVGTLVALPELRFLAGWRVAYQGREVANRPEPPPIGR